MTESSQKEKETKHPSLNIPAPDCHVTMAQTVIQRPSLETADTEDPFTMRN